jgi:radical SAM protein with 4Fe4S-binding SPASM domain
MYARLNPDYRLHLNPEGGYLIARREAHQERRRRYEVNPAAVTLLRDLTADADLRTLFSSQSAAEAEAAHLFLADGARQGYIELSEIPLAPNTEITGSNSRWSPYHFVVELTDKCNLRCLHCYRDSNPGSQELLPTPRLIKLLEELRANGVLTVELTGGEPLFRPDARKVILASLELFDFVALLSNGWFVDQALAEMLAPYSDKILVQIDLDGPTAEIHDTLRGEHGSWKRATEAIHTVAGAGLICRVVMNVYEDNFDYAEEVLQLAKSLGASIMTVSPIIDVGRATGLNTLNSSQIGQLQPLLSRLDQRYSGFFFPNEEKMCELRENDLSCGAGFGSLVLGPQGGIRFCPMVSEQAFPKLGNLEHSSYANFLDTIDLSIFDTIEPPTAESCSGCEVYPHCHGCIAKPFLVRQRFSDAGNPIQCRWIEASGFGVLEKP